MSDQFNRTWILETIQEGGYSFSELRSYACKHLENENVFYQYLRDLIESNKIEVYISAPHSPNIIRISKDLQMLSIRYYSEIVNVENLIGALHYFSDSFDL